MDSMPSSIWFVPSLMYKEQPQYWYEKSGAEDLRRKSLLAYTDYVHRSLDIKLVIESDRLQIELDVPRAILSLHKYVLRNLDVTEDSELEENPVKSAMDCLRRILLAYSVRNPRVGYVQGHGDIVSFLLGCLQEREEDVFWIYCTVIERIYPADFFARSPKLQGFHVDMEVMSILLKEKLTNLSYNLSEDVIASISSLLSLKWFVSLWVEEIPFASLIQVWSFMLTTDIGPVVHFLLALSILENSESKIIQFVNEDDADPSFAYKIVIEYSRNIQNALDCITSAYFRYDLRESYIEELRQNVRAIPQFVEQEIDALSGITHFDKRQLELLELEFRVLREESRRRNYMPTRGIDKEALKEVLGRVIPEWPQECQDQLFAVSQPDALGYIDFQSLMLILSVLCKGTVEEKIKLSFDLYDVERVGFLDVEKMIKFAGSLCKIYQYKFSSRIHASLQPDAGNSNSNRRIRSISSDSSAFQIDQGYLWSKGYDRVQSLSFISKLLKMDLNGDMKLSYDEWCQGSISEPEILRCFLTKDADDVQLVNQRSLYQEKFSQTSSFHKRSLSSEFSAFGSRSSTDMGIKISEKSQKSCSSINSTNFLDTCYLPHSHRLISDDISTSETHFTAFGVSTVASPALSHKHISMLSPHASQALLTSNYPEDRSDNRLERCDPVIESKAKGSLCEGAPCSVCSLL